MSLGENIKEFIVGSLKDILAQASESNLNSAIDVLGSGVRLDKGSVVDTYLSFNPVTFTGGGSTSIWSNIQQICENAVVPIAGVVLTIILLTDLIQMVISGNNFKDFDTSIFFKWIFKSVCGIILVSNVFYITSGIFAIGNQVTLSALGTNRDLINVGTKTIHIVTSRYGVGELFTMMLLSFLVMIALYLVVGAIVVAVLSRMIEMFMYLGASPISVATFMNPEWKQMGHNWLRGLIALAFQGLFIVITLTILSTILSNTVKSLNSGGDITGQLGTLFCLALASIFTVFRSGQISKSIFGTH